MTMNRTISAALVPPASGPSGVGSGIVPMPASAPTARSSPLLAHARRKDVKQRRLFVTVARTHVVIARGSAARKPSAVRLALRCH
jgi:hypothetical protein